MKIENTKVYVSDDGKKFDTEKECAKHEKRMSKTKLFVVRHCPDLTEGRGLRGCTVFVAPPIGYEGNQVEMMFEDFCYRHFGRKVEFVQGVAPTTAWHYREISYKDLPIKHGFGTHTPKVAEVVELKVGEREEGYVFPE